MYEFRLGRAIATIVPFHTIEDKPIQQPKKEKEIITTKLVIVMVIIAIVKIAVLLLWI